MQVNNYNNNTVLDKQLSEHEKDLKKIKQKNETTKKVAIAVGVVGGVAAVAGTAYGLSKLPGKKIDVKDMIFY